MEKHPLNPTIICSDNLCRFNVGGGVYGLCQHPVLRKPMYFGGISRLYRSTCKAREDDTHGANNNDVDLEQSIDAFVLEDIAI